MSLGTACILKLPEVELLIGCEGVTAYQVLTNSECWQKMIRSELAGANVRQREGNSPDHRLRP